MTNDHSDALVFFGSTGDLAFKKIFPSLQAMAKRGNLTVPVIGIGRSAPDVAAFKARARESLENEIQALENRLKTVKAKLSATEDCDDEPATTASPPATAVTSSLAMTASCPSPARGLCSGDRMPEVRSLASNSARRELTSHGRSSRRSA